MAGETDIRQGLVTYLTSLTDLVTALGGVNKISPMRTRMPTDYPWLRYQVIDEQRIRSSEGPCGTATARMQLDVMSKSYDQAVSLSWLIRGRKDDPRIDGFLGVWGDIGINDCVVDAAADEADPPIEGSDDWIYRVRIDLTVTYEEV